MRTLLVLASSLCLIACGATSRNGGTPYIPRPDLGSGWGDDGGPGGPIGGIDPGGGSDCSDAAKLIYVVDSNNVLSSFKPDTLTFSDIGTLNCPAEFGATPFSMGIDRTPAAWVLYSSGELFHVDVSNAKCTATGFVAGQEGFLQFGMGFVSDAPSSTEETLFIAGGTGTIGLGNNSLGTIDLKTLTVSRVDEIVGSPELSGTGDANLWGFFPDIAEPHVAQIDKKSGNLANEFALRSIAGQPAAWAFAVWGGDFWIFLMRDTDDSTTVYRLSQSTGRLQAVVPRSGRMIVGAGVSTCAPITIG